MDKYDFAAQPTISRDRIYVSWNEHWDVARYVDHYLQSRRLRRDEQARAQVRKYICEFRGHGALRKADVDYYLDVNVRRELELPAEAGLERGRKA